MKPTNRRKFLLAAGIGSAGAVAAVATQGVKAPEAAAPQGAQAAQGDGYRLTEHIQKYYRTTEV